jgi:hypothetical protein
MNHLSLSKKIAKIFKIKSAQPVLKKTTGDWTTSVVETVSKFMFGVYDTSIQMFSEIYRDGSNTIDKFARLAVICHWY